MIWPKSIWPWRLYHVIGNECILKIEKCKNKGFTNVFWLASLSKAFPWLTFSSTYCTIAMQLADSSKIYPSLAQVWFKSTQCLAGKQPSIPPVKQPQIGAFPFVFHQLFDAPAIGIGSNHPPHWQKSKAHVNITWYALLSASMCFLNTYQGKIWANTAWF